MDAFIDTSILIPAIIECPDSDFVRNFIQTTEYRLIISPLIYHEAMYAGTKILLRERFEIESIAALRKHIHKNGYRNISDFIDRLNLLVNDFSFCADSTNIQMISQMADKYHLLSGDALILTTCMEHNISTLATFDHDFQKIDGLHLLFI